MIRPALFSPLPGIVAGFTTRDFAAPSPDGTWAARQQLAVDFGFPAVASVGQVHKSDVVTVQDGGHVPDHDGLVTDRPDLLLTVISADCALLLLADPQTGVLGACHAGWRGTVAGVLGQTVGAMQTLGADPGRTRAYLSPCISAEAFEVGEEVAAHFQDDEVLRRPEWPRPHVDLKAVLARQLREAGIRDAHVEIDPACTATDLDRFYSYRAEGGTPGRMVGFIGRRSA